MSVKPQQDGAGDGEGEIVDADMKDAEGEVDQAIVDVEDAENEAANGAPAAAEPEIGSAEYRDRLPEIAWIDNWDQLNELDCGDGRTVWANVWHTDDVVGIDLTNGRVTAVVDATGLRPPSTTGDPDAVLNGIAAIPGAPGEFLLAGKRWPTTYRVRFAPAP